jgi:N-acetylneuraminic acid mutarotase
MKTAVPFLAKNFSFLAAAMVVMSMAFLPSCSHSSNETTTLGNWSKTTPFRGRPRSGDISFTVGDTVAYIGLGYDGQEYVTDFFKFNINKGYWESRAPFPGAPRERAVSFSLNGRGYVGLGFNRDSTREELGDFWQYDPGADAWTQIANFKGTARYNAVAFALGNYAYVGTGFDGVSWNSDFYQYDPGNNSWKEIQSYPGEKIESGVAFVVNNLGYVCSGRNNGIHNLDFWEFNGSTWTSRRPTTDDASYSSFTPAVQRHDAMAFTMGGKSYIMGGISSNNATLNSVYEFDPSNYSWTNRTSFEGSARALGVAFVLADRGFVGTGQNATSRYDDIWEFKPNEAYDANN